MKEKRNELTGRRNKICDELPTASSVTYSQFPKEYTRKK
jgi:hypothetical protein